MQFSEIVGQNAVKSRLVRSVQEGRIAHAQLFYGQEGVGKLQLAIAYAQYVACEHRTADDSCGVCPSCVKYAKLQHPDLHFVFPVVKPKDKKTVVCDDFIFEFRDMVLNRQYFSEQEWYASIRAETKAGMIYANESTEIFNKLNLKSYEGGYKVMIIWLPEKMNVQCANKLLKLLEEPQGRTMFIMVSNAPDMIITTILSRLQQIQIPALGQQEIADALVSRRGMAAGEAAYFARVANGSLSKALAMVSEDGERRLNFQRFTDVMRMAWLVGNKRDYDALMRMRQWSDDMSSAKLGREQQKAFFRYAQYATRENYIHNLRNAELNYLDNQEQAFSNNFARFVNERNVEDMMDEFSLAERQLDQNGNAKMIFFDVALKLIMLLKR